MAEQKPAIDHDLIRELAKLLDETGLTEIEFERDGVTHGHLRGFDRGLRPQRAAEIGVQHRTGQIEYRPQIGLLLKFETCHRGGRDAL